MKIILVDGYAMMFRAFYAVRFAPTYKGTNLNAVYGCATTLMQAIEQFEPGSLVIAFDSPEKTFRHKADSEYKAQRKETPDEFIAQIEHVFNLVKAFDIPLLMKGGFEADDIIGTLAKKAEQEGRESFILSGDLDFLQLISDKIHLAKFNGREPLIFNDKMTFDKLGVHPNQVVDYKAICGDSSDNYKGIPGIGPKGATKLLSEYKTLQNIYDNIGKLPENLRIKFIEHKKYAFHCQYLAQIDLDVPLDFDFTSYQLPRDQVFDFFTEVNFPSLLKRIRTLGKKEDIQIKLKKEEESQMSLF